jgi:glycosyltransferase involved in cell wall biosynthesis
MIAPKVLVLAPDIDGPGGIERATRACIRAFEEKFGPERVGLLTLGKPPDGVLCHVLVSGKPVTGRVGMLQKVGFARKALRVARLWKKDLVLVAAHPHLAPVGVLSSWLTGARCAVWCHGKESWGRIGGFTIAGLRRASLVFAPSHFTARQVERVAGLGAGSVRVVHHGLGHELLSAPGGKGPNARSPAVLAVARLVRQDSYKGIDSLLSVWPRVSEQLPGAELWVVGDGTDSGRLASIAKVLSLDGRVRFFGEVSDAKLLQLYGRASVFALPTRFRLAPMPEGEGFGLVYIEAGIAGLPVIGARGGGVEDAIEHGRTGLLVDPEDPNQLEHALVRLLTDEELAKRMGEEGRKRAETEFSYRAFADRICGVVDELLAKRPGRKVV